MQGLPPEQFPSNPCSPDPEMERQNGEIEGQIEDVYQTLKLSHPPSPNLASDRPPLLQRVPFSQIQSDSEVVNSTLRSVQHSIQGAHSLFQNPLFQSTSEINYLGFPISNAPISTPRTRFPNPSFSLFDHGGMPARVFVDNQFLSKGLLLNS